MFSPAKVTASLALVAAVGGTLLLAEPFEDQGAGVSAAAEGVEHAAPVEVTGTGFAGPCSGPSQTEVVDGISYESGLSCETRWEMSDPRLDGAVTWASSRGQDDIVGFGYSAVSIEHANGTWRQRPVVSVEFPGLDAPDVEYLVLDGDGDYEGLIALLTLVDDTESEADWRLHGYIIDGAFPPPPENASTKDVLFSYRWGSEEWRQTTISQGGTSWFSWRYTNPSERTSPDFVIRFQSRGDSLQYGLTKYAAHENSCADGKLYVFEDAGRNGVDLYSVGD